MYGRRTKRKGREGLSFAFIPPAGFAVRGVTAECPYMEEGVPSIAWSRTGDGAITAEMDTFDTYWLVTLSFNPAT